MAFCEDISTRRLSFSLRSASYVEEEEEEEEEEVFANKLFPFPSSSLTPIQPPPTSAEPGDTDDDDDDDDDDDNVIAAVVGAEKLRWCRLWLRDALRSNDGDDGR